MVMAENNAPLKAPLKVGDVFYAVWIDPEEGGHTLEEWHVRMVRAGNAHLVQKTKYTWVKLSTVTGDYGWAPKIEDWNRKTIPISGPLPDDFATTKRGAYRLALPAAEVAAKRLNRLVASLRAQMTREKAKAKAKRQPKKQPFPATRAPAPDLERIARYREMPGNSAYDQIAEDHRAGILTEEEARSFCDMLFPIVTPAK